MLTPSDKLADEILNTWELYCSPRMDYSEEEAAQAVADDLDLDLDIVLEVLASYGITLDIQ